MNFGPGPGMKWIQKCNDNVINLNFVVNFYKDSTDVFHGIMFWFHGDLKAPYTFHYSSEKIRDKDYENIIKFLSNNENLLKLKDCLED